MANGPGALANGADASIVRLPGLRPEPRTPADTDGALLSGLLGFWSSQDTVMRERDLSIEEHISFLANRQWIVYNDLLGRHFDVTEWMDEDEKRYRQRPVVNLLMPWFLITHARLTENPPIISFIPGPDQKDAQLAEVLDVIGKKTWRDAGMTDVLDRLFSWLIPSGEVYFMSRIDLTKGKFRPRVGKAPVMIVGPDGQPLPGPDGQPMQEERDGVPLGEKWESLAQIDAQSGNLIPTGEPVYDREGQIVVDVLPAPCVRGTFGNAMPWHEKPEHIMVGFYTPEYVWDTWGVEVEPDVSGVTDDNPAMESMLFGHGYFTPQETSFLASGGRTEGRRNLCRVYQYFQKPSTRDPQFRQTPTSPGGRYTVFTRSRVLVDGTRPVAYPYTSPIRKLEFVRIPGRPAGTTVQASLIGPQRNYNKRRGQLGEHASLTANPKAIIDIASGIKEGQWTNEPGTAILANMRQGVDPVKWLSPPALGDAVNNDADRSRDEIETIGATKGTGGEPLSPDESGESRKERRFDSDRYVGPTQRRASEEFGRMHEDWKALYPVIYDEERVVRDGGEDNLFRTVLVMPQLFEEGNVNVVADLESMLPESRGERQSRLYTLWKDAALGDPMDPDVRQRFLEMSRFPHLSRVARFGTVDAQTADQENGALLVGEPVPVLPFYDHAEHLRMHNKFRKSREFLKLDPMIRQMFDIHCSMHEQALAQQEQEQLMRQAAQNAILNPQQTAPGGGGGGGPAPSNVSAQQMAAQPSGMTPPAPSQPMDGAPGRLPPRVLGTTAASPAGM